MSPSGDPNVLLVCHVSAAEVAARAARALYVEQSSSSLNADEPAVDILCYGRAGADLPAPVGARFVGPAVQEDVSRLGAMRLVLRLRSRRYRVVALSQPHLAQSRARGLLMALSRFIGGRSCVILDPLAQHEVMQIGAPLAFIDLLRWITFTIAGGGLAEGAAVGLRRLGSGERPRPGRRKASGRVIYLRTDIELSLQPLQTGGSVAHTEGILQALLDRGHSVSYWGTGDVAGIPLRVERRRLPVLLKGNVPIEIAELVSGILQAIMVVARRATRAPITRGTGGFVYQRYSLNNLAGVLLARLWRVPLVLEANGSEAKWRQDFGTLKYPRLAYACERVILQQADVVTAVSANAAEDLIAAGADASRLKIVPNGVSVRRFQEAMPLQLPRNLDGGFVVSFVGLFYPWHGVRFLAEAFILLHHRVPDARLLLVGDGEEAPMVRSILESQGVLEAAHFTGLVPRTEAPRYMASSNVLVSPHANVDHFIGSPIKLFEYMAAGRPIVATRVGQIPDILKDEVTALLVEPENPAAMAAALERLHDDDLLGQRLGRAAAGEAARAHSWDARLAAILGGSSKGGLSEQ